MAPPVEYPAVRAEVIGALRALADPEYQRRVWLEPNEFDSLTFAVDVLFGDSGVLPDPSRNARTVGAVVHESEVPALRRLGTVFDEVLNRLGGCTDDAYLDDAAWLGVVEAARAALGSMYPEEPEPVFPLFYFWGSIVEMHDEWGDFDNGLEAIDVEDGEYDRVFDAIGGQWHFRGGWAKPERPAGRWATLRWRVTPRREWLDIVYLPPSPTSRARLAHELRRVLDAAAEDERPLEDLVGFVIEHKTAERAAREAERQRRRWRSGPSSL